MAERGKRYVIVGNGVAGTTAAERIRKGDPAGEITLITDEPYPLYNRVSLPPFLKLEATEKKVMIRPVEWHEKMRIDLRRETRVVAVNQAEQTIVTDRGQEIPWDKLLVATGGTPNHLKAPGAEGTANIFYFQTLDDTKRIMAQVEQSRSAIVVGGSFISYELTEGFAHRGIHTTWLMRGPRFLHRVLDEEGGDLTDVLAKDRGVDVIHGEEVASVQQKDGLITGVITTAGRHIPTDMLACGLGLRMNVGLLDGTDVQIKRGIVADERMRTTVPNIFTAGDVAEFYAPILGNRITVGTWANSTGHGKIAAANMLGGEEVYDDVPAYTSGLFDSTIAVYGFTPENAPGMETIARCDMGSRTYRRLFILDNRLVGSVSIGTKGRRGVMEYIKGRTSLPTDRSALLAELD